MSSHPRRILIIDDDKNVLKVLKVALQREGYEIDIVRDGNEGLARLANTQYDLIVCDMQMPGLSGSDFHARLNEHSPEMADKILFMTGDIVRSKTQEFLKETRAVFINKPFDLSALYQKVREAIDQPKQ
jgi:CheY-like chemotaxis protein